MASFYTILTSIGQAKVANAVALGQKVNLSTLAVGDAKGVTPQPDANAKALVNERRRAPLNRIEVDKDNPNFIVCEQVLPPEVGGWEIREIGVFDDEGNLIAYGNYPPTYKPLLNEGTSRTQTVRMMMQVSDAAAVTLKVDPSVVLATRQYVDEVAKTSAEAFKTLKSGLGDAATMSHSKDPLENLAGSQQEVADTAQLVALRRTLHQLNEKLKDGANRDVDGSGKLITTNFLKDHAYFSIDHAELENIPADNVIREINGTGFIVRDAGYYFVTGAIRVWANNGGGAGSAGTWGASIMVNGQSVSMQSANRNNVTAVDNRDGTVPVIAMIQVNKGDHIAAGFYYGGGTAWDKIIFRSTLSSIKLGD